MTKAISYILSSLYYVAFFTLLLIFHVAQWLALKLGGYDAHMKVVFAMNYSLVKCLWILGTRVEFNRPHAIPEGVPLIIVSNHQSMNDIPAIIWYLRKHHPKFVAKKELGKGIPSVSFNLRHGGSALIDRKDAKQSITEIMKLGAYIEKHQRAAVIFPEGTRSRDGAPRRFSENGIKMLMKKAPSAYILPITVNNSWKFHRYGSFPLGLGTIVTFDVHEAIPAKAMRFDALFEKIEHTITKDIIH